MPEHKKRGPKSKYCGASRRYDLRFSIETAEEIERESANYGSYQAFFDELLRAFLESKNLSQNRLTN